MKLILLGCGTSTGVPRVGGEDGQPDWGLCDPDQPKNRRTRASIMVESDAGKRILVDTGTDLRQQLLANNIHKLDAVFWTHDHADHCHDIDDLRPLRYGRGGPIAGYAVDETMRRLRNRFSYVFSGQHGYHTLVEIEGLDRLKMCMGFGVGWTQMPHGPAESTAFRFDCDGKSIGYATDFSAITAEMVSLFHGVDLLVTDCLRREPHPTHAHLGMSLELIEAARADRAVLTHLDKSMDYVVLSNEIPPHVEVGYDGMVINLRALFYIITIINGIISNTYNSVGHRAARWRATQLPAGNCSRCWQKSLRARPDDDSNYPCPHRRFMF